MKKLILLFITLSFLVVSADANYYGVIARKNASATCDQTNIVFFWTAELEDFSSTNNSDCNEGDQAAGTDCADVDETATTVSGAVLSADADKYGTKGLSIPSADDYMHFGGQLGITGDEEGRIGFWVYFTALTNETSMFRLQDDGDDQMEVRVTGTTGSGEVKVYWTDGEGRTDCVSTDANMVENTWYYIEAGWKPADNMRTIMINGVAPSMTDCGTTIDVMSGGGPTLDIWGCTAGDSFYYMDNMILSTDSTQELYNTGCATQETYE